MAETSARASITVNVPQQRAFAFFTRNFAVWWPTASHSIGEGSTGVTIEPHEGGRWYEHGGPDECDWGRVLVWDPPARIVLAWQLDHTWSYDPDLVTEVEVRFIAEGETATRVELEHRRLERFAEHAEQMRAKFAAEGGWSGLLRAYARAIAA